MLRFISLFGLCLFLTGCAGIDPVVNVSVGGSNPAMAQIPWAASSKTALRAEDPGASSISYKVVPVTPALLQKLQHDWYRGKSIGQTAQLRPILPPPLQPQPYRLGPGDELEISLVDPLASLAPQGGQSLNAVVSRLDETGRVVVPHAGSLDLGGKTLGEAQAQIKQAIKSYIKSPQVFVRQTKFASQAVTVSGAVARPGVQSLTDQPLTLAQALAQAGGAQVPGIQVAGNQAGSVALMRQGRLYQIPLQLLQSGGFRQALYLQNGDQIQVTAFQDPNAINPAFAYVGGEVLSPQRVALPHQQNQPVTLADVLFEAKGWAKQSADPRHVYVIRQGGFTPQACGIQQMTVPKLCALIFQINLQEAGNFVMATHFPIQSRDFVFVASKPIARWNSALSKIMPSVTGLVSLSQGLNQVQNQVQTLAQ